MKRIVLFVLSLIVVLSSHAVLMGCINDTSSSTERNYQLRIKNPNYIEVDRVEVLLIIDGDSSVTVFNKQLAYAPAIPPDSGTIISLEFLIQATRNSQIEVSYVVYSIEDLPIISQQSTFKFQDEHVVTVITADLKPVTDLLSEHAYLKEQSTLSEIALLDSLMVVHVATNNDTISRVLSQVYLNRSGVDSVAFAKNVKANLEKTYTSEIVSQLMISKFPEDLNIENMIVVAENQNVSSSTVTPLSSLGALSVASSEVSLSAGTTISGASESVSSGVSSVGQLVSSNGISSQLVIISSSSIGPLVVSSSSSNPTVSSSGPITVVVENSVLLCSDNLDNDNDGSIDCDDVDCGSLSVCSVSSSSSSLLPLSSSSLPLVSSSSVLPSSSSAIVLENTDALCQDGLDNDGDGPVDCHDTDCQALSVCLVPTQETGAMCNDSKDNDNDGRIDCDDSDCDSEAHCTLSSSSSVSSSSSAPQQGTIQLTCQPAGSCTHADSETIDVGTSIEVTAVAAPGYKLSTWDMIGTGLTRTSGMPTDETITITLDNSNGGEARAYFTQIIYTVSLGNILHGSIQVNTIDIVSAFNLKFGIPADIEAIPEDGWELDSWNSPATLTFGNTTASTTVTKNSIEPTGPIVITPTFKGKEYQASIVIDSMFVGGTSCANGTTPGGETNCGWGSGSVIQGGTDVGSSLTFTNGAATTLTAIPQMGNQFKVWIFDGSEITADSTGDELLITAMGKNSTIRAVFDSLTVGTVAETGNATKTYTWKRYGDQIWMTENLNVIPGSGSLCYQNDCDTYGRFYQFIPALDVCDELETGSWELPSDSEWGEFEVEIGLDEAVVADPGVRGGVDFGKRIASENLWENGGVGNNSEGFNALPTGYFSSGAAHSWFGRYSMFWSRTAIAGNNPPVGWVRFVDYNFNGIGRYSLSQDRYYSVRCAYTFD